MSVELTGAGVGHIAHKEDGFLDVNLFLGFE